MISEVPSNPHLTLKIDVFTKPSILWMFQFFSIEIQETDSIFKIYTQIFIPKHGFDALIQNTFGDNNSFYIFEIPMIC